MEGLPRHTPTVRLGELVERVVSSAHDDLVKLASSAPGRAEVDRKRELARYLHTLRQRLTRLAVLAEWAPVQRRARISILCGDMLGQLEQHDRAFADAADRLFGLHQQMAWARAPLFDLPGALDVLCNGEYSALPRAIAEVAQKPARSADDPETELERSDRLNLQARVEREMRSKLLDEKRSGSLPEGVKIWSIKDGVAVVGVPGEYRATLALGGPPPLPPPPPPPNPGEAPPEPAALAPPPPLGGWLVKKIEMLAGARDLEDDATAEPRAFTLTKLEDRVLGERATARMAGMSPPPPAPPELVENGAEGIAGLHRVGRDAALRLVAATIAEQTKRVALRGGAWHGGAVRVEPIKASDATAEKIPDAAEKIPAEKKHGKGEGIRVWFWLPGARQSVGAAGTRLAGVDVGSVEVSTAAAANDAVVAAGTVPRIELVYQKGVDAVDGRIVARALVPEEKELFGFSSSSEDATPRRESGEAPTPPACAGRESAVRHVLGRRARGSGGRRARRVAAPAADDARGD
jgi:mediator of RNA polymerase II transcription subunit 14